MRVALVHDWLVAMRGGERVLEQLVLMYPDCDIYTLLHVPGRVSQVIEQRPIHPSFIQQLPFAAERYRYYLPFFPRAIEQFELDRYDLVISSSHCVAKGVKLPAGLPHISYCHTPMRYLYDQSEAYAARFAWPVRAAFGMVRSSLAAWDRETGRRVPHIVANSMHVRERITTIYGRDASVVHPPVSIERFHPSAEREDFYLCVSALVPYKRVDLLVDAFNRLGLPLVIAGSGPELPALRRRARANIRFTGWLNDDDIAGLMSRCRAFSFAGVEDFGIAMVEAQAAGAPVIAYAAGGALESVIDDFSADSTGVLFHDQSAGGVVNAIEQFVTRSFRPTALRNNAMRFTPEAFRAAMRNEIDVLLNPVHAAAD